MKNRGDPYEHSQSGSLPVVTFAEYRSNRYRFPTNCAEVEVVPSSCATGRQACRGRALNPSDRLPAGC